MLSKSGRDGGGWRWLVSPRAWLMLWIPIAVVSYFHYSTGASHHWLHDIFRRLYYIPIILGAFSYGLKGGLSASLMASFVYAPHAFTRYFEHDPGSGMEKILEIALYNVVALITGYLAQRERFERVRQESIARELSGALEEKRLLEEQLIRAGKLKALGELTAGIAHEIKNPLASIKGASEAISDEIPADSPRMRLVEIQARELNRLGQTLDRFLSFARPNRFTISGIDLCDLARHVVRLVEPQARKNGVELVVDGKDEQAIIEGDRDQLTQVLVNLVINASDAMPDGGKVTLRIRSETIGGKSYQVVDVVDTGPGVPEEVRERVFDPFYSTKEGGTGLGLSISANIADVHGGFIRVEDGESGNGATFSVYLPISNQSE